MVAGDDDPGGERRPPWQGAPGFSGVDPTDPAPSGGTGQVPPHAPLPGAPPYPPGTEPERAGVGDHRPGRPPVAAVLPRCVAASAGWVLVAVLVAFVAGVGSWWLRALALLLPWAATVAVLTVPARRSGAGPGALVALAFGPFWVLHALAVGLLG